MDGMKVIKSIMQESASLKAQGKDVVSLGVGVPFYGMPREMKAYCGELLRNSAEIDGYTPFAGLPKLRSRIAELMSEEMQREVSANNVLVTAGSMSGLYYAFKGILGEGDEVIVPSPYFLSYRDQVELCGGRLVEVEMLRVSQGSDSQIVRGAKADVVEWRLNIDEIENVINGRTRAVVINSPHNPTGAVFGEEELREVARLVIDHNLYLITDEAYDFLTYDEYFNPSVISELKGRIVRCGSYSKRFGMTGWRIGYLMAEGEVMERIMKVHDNISVCAPHLSQEAVWYGLTHEMGEMVENLEGMKENRRVMMDALDEMGLEYAIPQGAFYVMVKCEAEMSSVELAQRLLREAGVVVIPGEIFGKGGEGMVRLSFGGDREEMRGGVRRFGEWIRN